MKIRHFIFAALTLLCSATLLTACGSDDDEPSEDKTRAYIAFDSFFIIKGDALNYFNIDITHDGETHRVEKTDLTSNGIYKFSRTIPMSALPTTLKTKQVVTVREDVDFSNVNTISFSIGYYYCYSYLNAAKAVIDNRYYPSMIISSGEGGNTNEVVMSILDDIRNGDFNKEFTYHFDNAGELSL